MAWRHCEASPNAGAKDMAEIDDLLRELQERLNQLNAEITRIKATIELVEETRDATARLDRTANELPRTGPRERNVLPPSEIANLARETLLDNGRPLKRGALVRAMERRGVTLVGSDKAKNLGTILWRHRDSFVNIDGHGYWPADVPLNGLWDPNSYENLGHAN